MNIRDGWRRIARGVLGGPPKNFARFLVERDDSSLMRGPDVQQQSVPFDQRRTSDAKKPFRRLKVLASVHAPDAFAAFQIDAGDHAVSALRVHLAARNTWRRARPFVETKIIVIGGRVGKFPKRLA